MHTITRLISLAALCIAAFFLGSFYYHYSPLYQPIRRAVAVIYPTKGSRTSGIITFEQSNHSVQIHAHLTELTPGEHGFHIHEFGDCSCPDAICAGDHFNPTHKHHGGPQEQERHEGDLGNIVADESGIAIHEYTDTQITLNGPHTIIGRAVIIHAQKDDYVSQPTGNAGARVGCGVIGIKKQERT